MRGTQRRFGFPAARPPARAPVRAAAACVIARVRRGRARSRRDRGAVGAARSSACRTGSNRRGWPRATCLRTSRSGRAALSSPRGGCPLHLVRRGRRRAPMRLGMRRGSTPQRSDHGLRSSLALCRGRGREGSRWVRTTVHHREGSRRCPRSFLPHTRVRPPPGRRPPAWPWRGSSLLRDRRRARAALRRGGARSDRGTLGDAHLPSSPGSMFPAFVDATRKRARRAVLAWEPSWRRVRARERSGA